MTTAEETANLLLKIGAITINVKKPYRYTSGMLSPVYSDMRLLVSHPKERRIVIGNMVKLIKRLGKPQVVAGTATAGIPHAAWVSDQLNIPMIYVRSKAKEHGKTSQIEGELEKKKKVIVIEDLISTGGSSIGTVNAIRGAGSQVKDIVSIYSYEMESSKQNFKDAKVKAHYLTSFATVAAIAVKKKIIKESEKEILLDWAKAPKEWGKKMGFE